MEKFDDDFELDEFDKFDDADDDELFEKESQAEDFEERMSRETEAYLKDVEDDGVNAFGDGTNFDPFDYDELASEEKRERYEDGYYDGYDSERSIEDDLDE